MILTILELQKYSLIKNVKQLESESKKDSKLKLIFKNLQEKIKNRAKASYENQKVQTSVVDKILKITSTKFTTSKSFVDVFELSASEVKKLQVMKLSYEQFKSLFAFVSKFVLCNYSQKLNLAKHERFYSQCLAQVNLVLNKFTEQVMMSRSKNINVREVTFKNVTKKYDEFMKLLFDSKAKTSKLVKAKKDTRQDTKQIFAKASRLAKIKKIAKSKKVSVQ